MEYKPTSKCTFQMVNVWGRKESLRLSLILLENVIGKIELIPK